MTVGRRRTALITGISGQDGSFLAELLLEKGYRIVGLVRRNGPPGLGASEHLRSHIDLITGDLLDRASLVASVTEACPDELYHLAAPSFVPETWRHPAEAAAAIIGATATLLEAVRDHSPRTRVFLASSCTMFGATPQSPQREETPCLPQSPYATAKLAAHQLAGQLRSHDGLFACSGILYNHESERRPERFVTRKITRGAAAIKLGLERALPLGDLDAVRDWSFAGDIVRGAWLMLCQDHPADYVLASGTGHTVREFAQLAFAHVGLDAEDHLRVNPALMRAPEFTPLVGDAGRARERLGWQPSMAFEELVGRMVDCDLKALSAEHGAATP
jgi:GDPmannose 4,6-dehydratase